MNNKTKTLFSAFESILDVKKLFEIFEDPDN